MRLEEIGDSNLTMVVQVNMLSITVFLTNMKLFIKIVLMRESFEQFICLIKKNIKSCQEDKLKPHKCTQNSKPKT